MFGNAGSLTKPTRGSVAFPVSSSELDILPGNGGGTASEQDVETYINGQNTAATLLTSINPGTGPRNTIFRGATEIGQGAQIFVHGGLTTLEIPSAATSLTPYLDESVSVWNGDNHQWGDRLNIYTPPKSKTLTIGLGVGAAVLVLLIAGGVWYWRRKQNLRFLEEEERRVKGLALKNEDMLQKEHKRRSGDEHRDGSQGLGGGGFSPAAVLYRDAVYEPLQPPGAIGYADGYSTERGSFSYGEQPELVDDETAVSGRTSVHGPQQYSMTTLGGIGGHSSSSDGYLSRQPSHYQTVVAAPGHPVYGISERHVIEQQQHAPPAVVAMGTSLDYSPTLIHNTGLEGGASQEQLKAGGRSGGGPDQFRISLDLRTSLPGTRSTSTFTQQSSPYFGSSSTVPMPPPPPITSGAYSPHASYQQPLQPHYQQQQLYPQQQQQQQQFQASPTFSNSYSLPDSLSGATHMSGGYPSGGGGISPALSNQDTSTNTTTIYPPPSIAHQSRPPL